MSYVTESALRPQKAQKFTAVSQKSPEWVRRLSDTLGIQCTLGIYCTSKHFPWSPKGEKEYPETPTNSWLTSTWSHCPNLAQGIRRKVFFVYIARGHGIHFSTIAFVTNECPNLLWNIIFQLFDPVTLLNMKFWSSKVHDLSKMFSYSLETKFRVISTLLLERYN